MKSILVIGCEGSLGRSLVNYLAVRGYLVAGIDRAEVKANPSPLVKYVQADVSVAENCFEAMSQCLDELGKIEGVVNLCGEIFSGAVLDFASSSARHTHSFDKWAQVLNANLNTAFNVTMSAIDLFLASRSRGVIVNFSSTSAKGNRGQLAYGVAKAGVEILTKTCAVELGKLGIRCVAIAPGYINVNSTMSSLSEPIKENILREIPVGKFGATESVNHMVVSVLENEYLNGQVLTLDGGLTAFA